MVKNYLTAKQVEGILQTVREKQDYIGKIEREVTRAMVATGKRNSTSMCRTTPDPYSSMAEKLEYLRRNRNRQKL